MNEQLLVSDVIAPAPSLWRMLRRALALHCPRCGTGNQFHHWVRRRDHCGGCGYAMEHRPDFFFGAYILNLMVTLLALFAVLVSVVIFEAAQVEPPVVPIVIVGLSCATLLPLFAYPYTFTIWAVIDLRSEPLELREIADALDSLDADRAEEPSAVEHSRL